MTLSIGCDIGGTSTRLALVEVATGKILEHRKHASHVGDYKTGVKTLAAEILSLSKDAPVGVAIASQLDPSRRKAMMAPNLKWFNVPLARDLEALIGRPVTLDNDVRGAAYGELQFGALKGVEGTAAGVFWGSGIGGAVIANGRVQSGGLSIAGEIGHMTYKAGGKLCPCGKRGCYEIYIGGHALDRLGGARKVLASKHGEQVLAIMGQHIGNLATLLDPDAIVIGGSVGLATFSRLKAAVAPHLLTVRKGRLKLVRAALGDDAGVLGASALAQN